MKLFLFLICCTFSLRADFEQLSDQAHIQILTPALAERKTAKLRLKNGLEIYLISDPGVKQSAAAVAVKVGSWSDPKEYPGMAHFLEHMLFMGTSAYPDEAEYMRYIRDSGGEVNAFTTSDRTVYMFSINNDAYEGALDRFSYFFIDPLFLPSCVGRELHAVDQEHGKNLENDAWRFEMILNETGNPGHPNAAFSCGNAETLSGIPQETLKNWYREHYSANQMHFVTLSSLPLEKLIPLVVEKFSSVPNHNLPDLSYPPDLFSSQQKGHFVYIKPVKDLRSVILTWEIPSEFALDHDRKPVDLVGYFLTNGSEKSLLQELKREKLAESISTNKTRFSKDSVVLQIGIDLTELGVQKINVVIERFFQAIARLKESVFPKHIFDEMRKMSLMSYQYQSRQEAFSFIRETAYNMVDEPLETYPLKTLIPTVYDPNFIASFIDSLTPKSCIFVVVADPKLTGVFPTVKEKWMAAEYTIQKIPERELLAWEAFKPSPQITLPPANPFIPQNLALLPAPEESSPTLLAQDEGSKIYFAQDKKYSVPEATAIFSYKTPLLDGSPKSRVLFDLYLHSLSEKLDDPLFFGRYAGLYFGAGQQDLDVVFTVNGYSDKLPLFLKTIFQNLKTVQPSKEEFEIYKQSLQSTYENASKELPVQQAAELLSSILYNDSPTASSKVRTLKNISYEEFIAFSSSIFKKGYIQGTLYGNLSQENASVLWSELKETLGAAPYPLEEQSKKSVLILSEKRGPYYVYQNTERQGNGIILALQEGPFSFEKKSVQQLLSTVLKEGFFDTLRTKQQTAYFVRSWDVEVEKQLMQLFAVQSITHHPQELLARFELFLEEFNHTMREKISLDRFETLRTMAIKTLEMPPENLERMASRLHTLAFKYDGDFQWIDKRIDALKNLPYDTFIQTAHTFLSRANLRRMAVLMEGFLPPSNLFRYEEISQDDLKGAGNYVTAK